MVAVCFVKLMALLWYYISMALLVCKRDYDLFDLEYLSRAYFMVLKALNLQLNNTKKHLKNSHKVRSLFRQNPQINKRLD